MTGRAIKVVGLNELQMKLDTDFLLQPELDSALESFERRLLRQGKGLGAQRNEIAAERHTLGATARSSLNYPRTTGSSWQRKNERAVTAMAPRVFGKMVKRIEERWAADGQIPAVSYEGLG